jgi:hypothetical protein
MLASCLLFGVFQFGWSARHLKGGVALQVSRLAVMTLTGEGEGPNVPVDHPYDELERVVDVLSGFGRAFQPPEGKASPLMSLEAHTRSTSMHAAAAYPQLSFSARKRASSWLTWRWLSRSACEPRNTMGTVESFGHTHTYTTSR